jgi:1-deoxy-D-xylulose-5-phosphate reductoisomerase
MNAANEVAVEAFLNRQIGFRMIDQLIARVMDAVPHEPITDIAGLLEQDRRARRAAQEYLQS